MLGPIIFHRYLSAGATYKAEVIHEPALERQIKEIAAKIDPFGPCNIQFRKVKGRVVPFEFNIRFSGTTPMRAFLGFNDVDMALRDLVFKRPPAKLRIRPGVIFRFWNEMIIEGKYFRDLKSWKVYRTNQHNAHILQNL
ncbi:MAG: carbamoyl phosphate synthase-like protein [Candidatus Omnitrophica bacterium ADurb.Bin277]|nr:MAG: carbamoyl phosphate synthase-like protein [Candidatus Omnitrophica bacterium ADurb.Bin277]